MTKYLTVMDVAKVLRIGKTNAYKLFNKPDFPKVTIGKKLIVDEEALEGYLSKYCKGTITLEG